MDTSTDSSTAGVSSMAMRKSCSLERRCRCLSAIAAMNLLKMVRLSRSLDEDSMCLLTKENNSKYSSSRSLANFISGLTDYNKEPLASYIY